jgi:hypothetical protein
MRLDCLGSALRALIDGRATGEAAWKSWDRHGVPTAWHLWASDLASVQPHGDTATTGRMLELSVRSLLFDDNPAELPERPDKVPTRYTRERRHPGNGRRTV